jgi:1-acyl-sn-glycerol-3-phosphate acyltransferase
MAQRSIAAIPDEFNTNRTGSNSSPFRSKLYKLWLSAGIALAGISFMMIALFYAVIVFPILMLVPATAQIRRRRVRRVIQYSFASFLRCCVASKLLKPPAIAGLEIVRETGGCIIIANHPTLFDVVVLGSLTEGFNCIVKRSLRSDPFLAGGIHAAGLIVADNGPQEIIRQATETLAEGQPVIIFPEGTRSPRGGVNPFSRGAAHLALRTSAPVVLATLNCDPPVFAKYRKVSPLAAAVQFTVTFSRYSDDDVQRDEGIPLPVRARRITQELEQFFSRQIKS